MLPVKRQERVKNQRTVELLLSQEEGEQKLEAYLHKNQRAAELLAGLLDQPSQPYELVTGKLHVTGDVIRAWKNRESCG